MRFLKLFTLISLTTLSSLSFADGGHVENFGEKGLFSDKLDIVDSLEGFMGNSFFCSDANRSEYDLIENSTPHTNILHDEHLNTKKGFDQWSEEIIFAETVQKSQKLSACQNTLFTNLKSDYSKQFEMEDVAWEEFQEIIPFIKGKITQREAAQDNVDSVKRATNFQEDRLSRMTDEMYRRKREANEVLGLIKSEISSAFSRLPLGNRYEMKEFLLELIEENNSISKADFVLAYRYGVQKITRQAQESADFFKSIKVKDKNFYRVNEDLKKSLVKTGQVANIVNSIGLTKSLESGFMCRTKARYDKGPTNLLIAEIPLYFTGVYGLGRATLAAGVKVVRATSILSKLTANAALWSARAATIGLEAYTYARIADEVRQICFPPEYIAAIKKDSCSYQSEVNGVFQEASIAACLTSAALGFGPIATIGAFRAAKFLKISDIIVTGKLNRNFFLTANESINLGKNKSIRSLIDDSTVNLKAAAKLTDKQRVYVFEEMSGVALTKADAEKLLLAHSQGPGYGAYSKADLRHKAQVIKEILDKQGLTALEIRSINRKLMRRGILGRTGNELSDLPQAAIDKIKLIREINQEHVIIKTDINFRNRFTNPGARQIDDILKDHPKMDKPMRAAHVKLSDNEAWVNYFEETITTIFKEMKNSGNISHVKLAEEGKISRKVMLEVFEKRFDARKLKISRIEGPPPGSRDGVLPYADFMAHMRKGPLLDDAFRNGLTATHGPYPHLFQLDFVIDDMVRASDNMRAQEFFDFWGGSNHGLSVWNDTFDLFQLDRQGIITLRDTETITVKYLNKMEVIDDMP